MAPPKDDSTNQSKAFAAAFDAIRRMTHGVQTRGPPGPLLFAATADVASLPGVAVLRGFLSAAACAELSHASRCLPAPGYRPGVRAALLPLLARVAPGLLPPLLAARGALRKALSGHALVSRFSP